MSDTFTVRKLSVAGACLLAISTLSHAQRSAETIPSGLVWLTDGWLYHAGDDAAWANPDLDDAGWEKHSPQQHTGTCVHGCWYRLHIALPPRGQAPLSLLLLAQSGVFEAYIEGQRMNAAHFAPWWLVREPLEFLLPLPPGRGSLVLAIRIRPPRFAFDADEAALLRAAVGGEQSVRDAADSLRVLRVTRFLPSAGINFAIFLAGVAFLLVYSLQQTRREYLWLGIYLAILGSSGGLFTAAVYGIVPGVANEFYADPALYLCMLAQTEFTFDFIGRKPGRLWRAYEAFLLSGPILSILCSTGTLSNAFYFAFESAAFVPAALAIPVLLFYWRRRGNRETRWLILPSLAPAAGVVLTNIPQFGGLLGWNLDFLARPVVLWGTAPLFPGDLANAVFLLAIGAVMLLRFTTVNREQARVSAELSAAREVQRQLVPDVPPSLPGCRFGAAYIPAAEVGGDFYQVHSRADGSSLVLLGDVSGKGLKAAMTGALAIGSFRALATEKLSPAELLSRLNDSICSTSSGGFITCFCGHLRPSGRFTLANAGHLPPYRNGQEIHLEGGLPLGIVPGLAYGETTIELDRGDTIALITDGVVEAQSASGELFGFDRTRAISMQTAAQMAAAAQAFGQTDDITVLSITFSA